MTCANHLEHIIEMEGPHNIAAVFMESVTGTNGGFIPPPEYWPRVREICDKYGILLVADEVFTGFGRTGKWFAVEHWNVVPDMITMAKGITGGYAPLGVVGVRGSLAERFDDDTLWCGLTGYAHPIACAAAVASIGVYEEDNLMEHAEDMGLVLAQGLQALYNQHERIGDVRNIGLYGTIEFVVDRATKEPMAPYGFGAPAGGFMDRLKKALRARNVHIAQRWTHLFIAPPVCITEDELEAGLALINEAISEAAEGDIP